MSDLDKLERLAKAATPGPWEYKPTVLGLENTTVLAPATGEHVSYVALAHARAENAAFIAAANPEAVLALVARVRQAEAVIEEALEAFRKPYENTTQPNSRMTAVLRILSTYEKGATQ